MWGYGVVCLEVPRSCVKRELRTPGHVQWTAGQFLRASLVRQPPRQDAMLKPERVKPPRRVVRYTLNEEPQPQEPVTFGLPNLNPAPCAPST